MHISLLPDSERLLLGLLVMSMFSQMLGRRHLFSEAYIHDTIDATE